MCNLRVTLALLRLNHPDFLSDAAWSSRNWCFLPLHEAKKVPASFCGGWRPGSEELLGELRVSCPTSPSKFRESPSSKSSQCASTDQDNWWLYLFSLLYSKVACVCFSALIIIYFLGSSIEDAECKKGERRQCVPLFNNNSWYLANPGDELRTVLGARDMHGPGSLPCLQGIPRLWRLGRAE